MHNINPHLPDCFLALTSGKGSYTSRVDLPELKYFCKKDTLVYWLRSWLAPKTSVYKEHWRKTNKQTKKKILLSSSFFQFYHSSKFADLSNSFSYPYDTTIHTYLCIYIYTQLFLINCFKFSSQLCFYSFFLFKNYISNSFNPFSLILLFLPCYDRLLRVNK